jgi:hypothetical protein
MLVGGGEDETMLRALAQRRGIAECVVFAATWKKRARCMRCVMSWRSPHAGKAALHSARSACGTAAGCGARCGRR